MPVHDELTLLLIEDPMDAGVVVASTLEAHGVLVTRVAGVAPGLREALRGVHDAVVLQLVAPAASGLALCRELRAHSEVPLLVVAESTLTDADRVSALEAGADDCVLDPFSPIELVARIHASVRRARRSAGPARVLRAGPLELFTSDGTVMLHGKPLEVTSYEFAILRVLAERRGRVLTREQILDYANGGSENAFERSIDVRISRLRRKLGEASRNHSIIRTIRGIGYSLTSE
jgi:DNA-binding response OmpR family regulator